MDYQSTFIWGEVKGHQVTPYFMYLDYRYHIKVCLCL